MIIVPVQNLHVNIFILVNNIDAPIMHASVRRAHFACTFHNADSFHPVVSDHANGSIIGLASLVITLDHVLLELLKAFKSFRPLNQRSFTVLLFVI